MKFLERTASSLGGDFHPVLLRWHSGIGLVETVLLIRVVLQALAILLFSLISGNVFLVQGADPLLFQLVLVLFFLLAVHLPDADFYKTPATAWPLLLLRILVFSGMLLLNYLALPWFSRPVSLNGGLFLILFLLTANGVLVFAMEKGGIKKYLGSLRQAAAFCLITLAPFFYLLLLIEAAIRFPVMRFLFILALLLYSGLMTYWLLRKKEALLNNPSLARKSLICFLQSLLIIPLGFLGLTLVSK